MSLSLTLSYFHDINALTHLLAKFDPKSGIMQIEDFVFPPTLHAKYNSSAAQTQQKSMGIKSTVNHVLSLLEQ
jgi:hypothetical protein